MSGALVAFNEVLDASSTPIFEWATRAGYPTLTFSSAGVPTHNGQNKRAKTANNEQHTVSNKQYNKIHIVHLSLSFTGIVTLGWQLI